MASLLCRKCGAEERNARNECLACKRERRKIQYARQVGRAPEPVAKLPAGSLFRFDEVDACQDAEKRRTLMASLWNAYLGATYFHDDEVLDQAHIDEMQAMPEAERAMFSAAADAQHLADRRAARHGRR